MAYTVYDDPETAKKKIKEYFDHCHLAKDYVSVTAKMAKRIPRAPTPSGICLWLNISPATYKSWGNGDLGEDFFEVIEWAKTYIKDTLMAGAACNFYVASFVDRILQNSDDPEWVDRKIVKTENGDNDLSNLGDDELNQLAADLQKTLAERNRKKLKVVNEKTRS
jgi:hypothetical protein